MTEHRLARLGVVVSLLATTSVGLTAVFPTPAAAVAAPTPGTIDTIAGGVGGSGALGVSVWPSAVAFASATVAIVADPANHVIRRVDTGSGTTSVVAGNGTANTTYGYGGCCSSQPPAPVEATSVALPAPMGVAVDAGGNIYVADALSQLIWKVDTGGMIQPFAGGGYTGGSTTIGDDGPAYGATLVMPTGVAVAPNGSLYIVESQGHRVRRVAGGIITTVAGDATANTPGSAGDTGPALAARLNSPSAVAVDGSGTIWIADTGNNRVRKVTAGTITAFAGDGTPGNGGDTGTATTAQLLGPRGVAVDGAGTVFIADSGNHRVRKVVAGTITAAAGTGAPGYFGDAAAATGAQLQGPLGVAATGAGIVAVADQLNSRVRRFTSGGSIATILGNGRVADSGDGGPAAGAQLNLPSGVAADGSGNVFVADTVNNRVRRVAANGTITTFVGTGAAGAGGDGGPATDAQLSLPTALAMARDGSGDLFIADSGNNKVRKVSGGSISTVAGNGSAGSGGDGGPAVDASLNQPLGLATSASGAVFIADSGNNKVRKVSGGTITTVAGNGNLGITGDFGPATSAELAGPAAVAVDGGGLVYIADTQAGRIRKVDAAGIITTFAGPTGSSSYCCSSPTTPVPALQTYFSQPRGLAFDASDALFVSDGSASVRRISSGMVTTVAGYSTGYDGDGWLATQARLNRPAGLAVDGAGTVFVADSANQRVRAFVPAGANGVGFHPVAPTRILDSRDGTGGYATPWPACTSRDLTVAGANGVPAGATAVVVNLTVTSTTADSFLSVVPKGSSYGYAQPITTFAGSTTTKVGGSTVPSQPCYGSPSQTSSVNWTAGQTIANQAIARVGEQGQITIFNNSGSVHVIADLVGWYDSGTEGGDHYMALPPSRLVDSRFGIGGFASPWTGGLTRTVQVSGVAGVPAGADAVVVNTTVTEPTASSHLRLWPADQAMPNASSINFSANQTIANLATIKLSPGGAMKVFNNSGSVQVIVDVVGYFSSASGDPLYVPISPQRWIDTRQVPPYYQPLPMGPASTASIPFAGSSSPLYGGGGSPSSIPTIPAGAKAVAINVTVTGPTEHGFLTLSPSGSPTPNASNINFTPNQTIANLALVKVGAAGKVDVYNAAGFTNVILDVVGYFV